MAFGCRMKEFTHNWWKSAWRLLRILSCVTVSKLWLPSPSRPPSLLPRSHLQLRLCWLAQNPSFSFHMCWLCRPSFFSHISQLLFSSVHSSFSHHRYHFPSGFSHSPSFHSSVSKFDFASLSTLLLLFFSHSSHLPSIHSSFHHLSVLLILPSSTLLSHPAPSSVIPASPPTLHFLQPTLSPPSLS